jgi:two-component sensor histidine kinase
MKITLVLMIIVNMFSKKMVNMHNRASPTLLCKQHLAKPLLPLPINPGQKAAGASGQSIAVSAFGLIVTTPFGQPERFHITGAQLLTGLSIVSVLFFLFACMLYRKKFIISRKLSLLEKNMQDQTANVQDMIREKDWLVKELHHRVKNNLQVVVSLLDSQSAYLTNPEAIQAIKNSQHRMFAISLVHQKLYQTESLSMINMQCYINELVQYLQDEYQSIQRVAVVVDTIPLNLDLASAIPLGLIINEAVSNTLQYAFPKKARGQIKITLEKNEENLYLLQIADNGVGLPAGFDTNMGSSLGTTLIAGLSQQLKADLVIRNINGVVISLWFKMTKMEVHPLYA